MTTTPAPTPGTRPGPATPRRATRGLRRRVRSAVCAVVAVVVAAGLGACTPDEDGPMSTPIDVVGEFGRRPQVAFDAPIVVTEPATKVLIEGDGRVLEPGDAVLIAFVALNGITGEVIDDSYGREPRSMHLTEEEAGEMYAALTGVAEGTRLLHTGVGTVSRPEPVVLVYDILHTRAWGEPVDPPADAADLPTVTLDDIGRPTVTIPTDLAPPDHLRVLTLIKGTGPQVAEGSSITAHYSTTAWTNAEEIDSTWGTNLAPPVIPFTGRIPAWQQGLSDATVGSQIMIIAPPAEAFGSDTIVFVIDVLATTIAPENGSSEEPKDNS